MCTERKPENGIEKRREEKEGECERRIRRKVEKRGRGEMDGTSGGEERLNKERSREREGESERVLVFMKKEAKNV